MHLSKGYFNLPYLNYLSRNPHIFLQTFLITRSQYTRAISADYKFTTRWDARACFYLSSLSIKVRGLMKISEEGHSSRIVISFNSLINHLIIIIGIWYLGMTAFIFQITISLLRVYPLLCHVFINCLCFFCFAWFSFLLFANVSGLRYMHDFLIHRFITQAIATSLACTLARV